MKRFTIYIILVIGFWSCTDTNYQELQNEETLLDLKFHAYPTGTNQDARIGLSWALSQVGAKNTALSFNGIIQENECFIIDIDQLGFDQHAKDQLTILHNSIRATQAYQNNGHIDMGRYIALLIGASEHYYRITNVPENLNDILANYDLNVDKGYVNNSAVSNSHRIIEFSDQVGLNQLFLATEITPNSNSIIEYETLEIMDNGHIRFGIFDVNGNRKNAASSDITNAGKPAKCMWCHESKIQPLFTPQANVPNFLTNDQLQDSLLAFRAELEEKQLDLLTGVDFSQTQDHVNMELAYISFMEPSAEVLSREWNMSIAEVTTRLSSLPTHVHSEFPFLGDLYHRHEVEPFAPFTALSVSTSVREASEVEVNHLN